MTKFYVKVKSSISMVPLTLPNGTLSPGTVIQRLRVEISLCDFNLTPRGCTSFELKGVQMRTNTAYTHICYLHHTILNTMQPLCGLK